MPNAQSSANGALHLRLHLVSQLRSIPHLHEEQDTFILVFLRSTLSDAERVLKDAAEIALEDGVYLARYESDS